MKRQIFTLNDVVLAMRNGRRMGERVKLVGAASLVGLSVGAGDFFEDLAMG